MKGDTAKIIRMKQIEFLNTAVTHGPRCSCIDDPTHFNPVKPLKPINGLTLSKPAPVGPGRENLNEHRLLHNGNVYMIARNLKT